MNVVSGTTRRLLTAFGIFFVMLGAASYFALAGLVEVSGGVQRISRANAGMRTALQLASAVRDQYAHQAHTIILGNDTHLGMHREASQRVELLLTSLAQESSEPEHKELIRKIGASTRELNQRFLDHVVPAVVAHDQQTVNREHARILEMVFEVQDHADHIAAMYGMTIAEAESRAAAVETDATRYVTLTQLGSLLFAAAMALYIGRSVAQPLARLEEGAARLARGGLETVISIDSNDEFGRLAAQFNEMTVSLREHQKKLIQHEKLASIGHLAAGVAHEINNPLGVILGYVRVLRKKLAPEFIEDLRIIEEEAVCCQRIVAGLLDLARPWAHSAQEVDLHDLCSTVVLRLREAGKLAEVDVEIAGHAITTGNDAALRQVLTNLVLNAVEAAGSGGWVKICLSRQVSGDIEITITDSGPGISAEVSGRLFEAFFTTKAQGTGLGLAVSQAIVQAHGGLIHASSAPEGGALFRIHLPPSSNS